RAFVTPVVPKTETARRARAIPPAIPMAIPIPISTAGLLGRGSSRRLRHVPPCAGPSRQLSEKPSPDGQRPAGSQRTTSRATPESSDVSGRSSDVVSEKLLLQAKRRMECLTTLSLSCLLCKLVERVAGEAASSEPAQERRRDAFRREQPPGAVELWLEGGHRRSSRLGGDQPLP